MDTVNPAGGVTFTNTQVSGCSVIGININNLTTFTLAASSSVMQTTGGSGVSVSGGNGTISFNGPITATGLNMGLDGISVTGFGQNPTVNFAAVTVDASTGRHGVLLQTLGGTSDINFNGILDINGAGTHGLFMDTVSGTVDITPPTSDIANATGSGMNIFQGAPNLTMQGTLTNNNISVSMTNVAMGAQSFFGGTITQSMGQPSGILLSGSDGTHEFASANLGTLANRLTATGININSCPGIFRFTNFNLFTTGLGLNIVGSLPTVAILPASTTAAINSTATALQHTAGSLTGTFTNIVANAGTNPGIRMSSLGGGSVTFGDIDVDTTSGFGIDITGPFTANFNAASTSTVIPNPEQV